MYKRPRERQIMFSFDLRGSFQNNNNNRLTIDLRFHPTAFDNYSATYWSLAGCSMRAKYWSRHYWPIGSVKEIVVATGEDLLHAAHSTVNVREERSLVWRSDLHWPWNFGRNSGAVALGRWLGVVDFDWWVKPYRTSPMTTAMKPLKTTMSSTESMVY